MESKVLNFIHDKNWEEMTQMELLTNTLTIQHGNGESKNNFRKIYKCGFKQNLRNKS